MGHPVGGFGLDAQRRDAASDWTRGGRYGFGLDRMQNFFQKQSLQPSPGQITERGGVAILTTVTEGTGESPRGFLGTLSRVASRGGLGARRRGRGALAPRAAPARARAGRGEQILLSSSWASRGGGVVSVTLTHYSK